MKRKWVGGQTKGEEIERVGEDKVTVGWMRNYGVKWQRFKWKL
jgi:hypothetical protein